MAYCDKCGAYIPDGIVECYACGYDPEVEAREKAEAEARAKAEAQATESYSYDRSGVGTGNSAAAAAGAAAEAVVGAVADVVETFADGVRKHVAEEKRRMQQEADREWAEREHERRQEEAEAKANEAYNKNLKPASNLHRIASALSYLSFGCFIVQLILGDDEFTKYHSRQGARLFWVSILLHFLDFVPVLGVIGTLFHLFCIYKGMTNALNCKVEPLPVIGENKKK